MHTLKHYINLVFGSDTQTGSTPAYVWMADQFGHVFIGFGGLFLVLWMVSGVMRRSLPCYGFGAPEPGQRALVPHKAVWIAAGAWGGLWLVKELYDLSLASAPTASWLFPSTTDLVSDFATDVSFYAIGMIIALAHFGVLGIRPFFVFLATLAFASWLVAHWVNLLDHLGNTNIPHLARIADVHLLPEQPSPTLRKALETDPLPRQCALYEPKAEPALECTANGTCNRKHFILYGLTADDMPPLPPLGSPGDAGGETVAMWNSLSDSRQANIKKMLPELRKLGIALAAEHVFRSGDGEIYYTTLLRTFEAGNRQKTLVIDNIESDLTRYALSVAPRQMNENFNNTLPVLENLFNDEFGTWRKTFDEKAVVWLSFSEGMALTLCRVLARLAPGEDGVNDGRAVLVRVGIPDGTTPLNVPKAGPVPPKTAAHAAP